MRKAAKSPTTQSELAAVLGVARQLVSSHARKQSAPPIHDVESWKLFLADVGRTGSLPADLRRKIGEKRLAILEQQRIAAVRENQLKAGEMMLTSDAQRMASEAMGFTFSELERLSRECPPAFAGLPAVEINKRFDAAIERMRRELQTKFAAIK